MKVIYDDMFKLIDEAVMAAHAEAKVIRYIELTSDEFDSLIATTGLTVKRDHSIRDRRDYRWTTCCGVEVRCE